MRVRHLRGESLQDDCVQNCVAYGGGSVHVWGYFCYGSKLELVALNNNVNGLLYRNIVQVNLLPWAGQMFRDNWRFQDDNAPGHRAQEVRYLHVGSGIQALEQLPVSPDYNPLKHIWASLGNAIDAQHVKPSKHGDLAQVL